MAPFYGAPAKMQNRHPAVVRDKNRGSPLGDDEPADHHVILVERQQLDSTTKPDSRPKDTAVLLLVGQWDDDVCVRKDPSTCHKYCQANNL